MEMEMETPPSPSPLNPKLTWTYDVFLSFRGEDTRKSFTDHLYAALNRKGIFTFRDDEELEGGKSIAPKLLKAIQESRFVIVILSRNYANSSWCLDELATMVDCMKRMGQQKVLPIFYHVDPSEVRKQTGDYGEAFLKHEESFRGSTQHQKLQRWRAALTEVANLSGWHLQDCQDRYESEVIEEVAEKVFTELNQTISSVSKDLVGMDSRLKDMLSYLEMEVHDVRVIGIWGMGGIGKTTLARVTSERIRAQFEGYSFLANVREVTKKKGPVYLQEQLLSDLLRSHVKIQDVVMGADVIRQRLCSKRVLIVLDDVDQLEQVEALCDRSWFAPGSRIIITSRDEHLLPTYKVNSIYVAKQLTQGEALQLFSWKSFQKDQVEENFLNLSKDVLRYANGLPLAIKVLGSFLFGRTEKMWSNALDRFKESPDRKILDVLEVSLDGLSYLEKKLFLDIACFFKGQDVDRVTRILESDYPHIGIEVLKEKSLVTLLGRKLWMHDLIQELGWEIVRRECREEPGKRSRLWLPKDIMPVLENDEGTNAIQGILLSLANRKEVHLKADPFPKMCKLRFLVIRNVNFSGSIEYLSNELQLLEWQGYRSNYLPSNFHPDQLVELRMNSSGIKQLWDGDIGWSMLRLIDLSDSQELIKTPNFTRVPNLERLVLEDCTKLVEIHPSLGFLKNLIFLSMKNCKSIEGLPPFINLGSLETFTLSSCSKLKKFPEIEGNMRSLLELHLDGTAIKELPPSIEHLTGLTFLNLGNCKNLVHLPSTIQSLTSLKTLILSGCSELDDIPESLNCMERLEELDISGTAIREFSPIAGLCSLTHLNLSDCNLMDGSILNNFGSLIFLKVLTLSGNNFVDLAESISQFSKLEHLDLSKCTRLRTLPKKPPLSLRHVNAEDCTSLTDFPDQYRLWASDVSETTTNSSLILPQVQVEPFQKIVRLGMESLECMTCAIPSDGLGNIRRLLRTERFQRDFEAMDNATSPSPLNSVCTLTDEIPEWFRNDHIQVGDSVETPTPPDLSDDGKWLGVAVCAVFSVEEPDSKTSNYYYQCKFGTPEFPLSTISVLDRKKVPNLWIESHMLCVSYVPRLYFREMPNKPSAIAALFKTNNPLMEVRKCSIRLVFEQDTKELSDVLTRCSFQGHKHPISRSPTQLRPAYSRPLKTVMDNAISPSPLNSVCTLTDRIQECFRNDHLRIGDSIETGLLDIIDKTHRCDKFPTTEGDCNILLRRNIVSSSQPTSAKEIEVSASPERKPWLSDWSVNNFDCWFRGIREIPDWFEIDYYPGSSAEILYLPPNLLDDRNWMGIIACASLSIDGHRQYVSDTPRLICHLRTDVAWVQKALARPISKVAWSHTRDLVWFIYLPRAVFSVSLNRCNQLSVKFGSNIEPDRYELRQCALDLVFKDDVKELEETLTLCASSVPKCHRCGPDETHA